MKILLSIGGASGSIYGIRLLEELKKAKQEAHLIVSDGAKKIIEHETKYKYNDIKKIADFYYENNDKKEEIFSLDSNMDISKNALEDSINTYIPNNIK